MTAKVEGVKEKIILETLELVREEGIRFSMDTLSKRLSMSKKTIYLYFIDKEGLLLRTLDYCFDNIKAIQDEVLSREGLSLDEKLKGLLVALPDNYSEFNFTNTDTGMKKYPHVYNELKERLDKGWENTFAILDEGKKSGLFKDVNNELFKKMYESTLVSFFSTEFLHTESISYRTALEEVADILVSGIMAK